MKKTTKGAIAAGAAVLLLLGTGGTIAYWNDSANLSGQNEIAAGQLYVEPDGTPTWTIQHTTGAVTPVADIAAVRIVPGDQLVYQGTYEITAQGQNLAFTVGLAGGSIAAADAEDDADVALAGRLTGSAVFSVDGGANTAPGTLFPVAETGDNAVYTYPATIAATITWPLSGDPAVDNPAKLGAVDLSGFAITVTQVDASL